MQLMFIIFALGLILIIIFQRLMTSLRFHLAKFFGLTGQSSRIKVRERRRIVAEIIQLLKRKSAMEAERNAIHPAMAHMPQLRDIILSRDPQCALDDQILSMLFDSKVRLKKRERLSSVLAILFAKPRHDAFLFAKTQSPHYPDRVIAAMMLGRPGNRHALFSLKNLLSDSSLRVRQAAAFAINGLKDGDCDPLLMEMLLQALEKASHPQEIKSLLCNLKLFAEPRLEATFLHHLKSQDESVRNAARSGLAVLQEK